MADTQLQKTSTPGVDMPRLRASCDRKEGGRKTERVLELFGGFIFVEHLFRSDFDSFFPQDLVRRPRYLKGDSGLQRAISGCYIILISLSPGCGLRVSISVNESVVNLYLFKVCALSL